MIILSKSITVETIRVQWNDTAQEDWCVNGKEIKHVGQCKLLGNGSLMRRNHVLRLIMYSSCVQWTAY